MNTEARPGSNLRSDHSVWPVGPRNNIGLEFAFTGGPLCKN